jgi:hypothetical protein
MHPILFHISNLLGFLFWQNRYNLHDLNIENNLLDAAESALFLMEDPNAIDTAIRVQAHCLLAVYHLWRVRPDKGLEYLQKAAGLARGVDLFARRRQSTKLTDTPQSTAQPMKWGAEQDVDHQAVGALSQLLWLDYCARVSMGAPPLVDKGSVFRYFGLQVSHLFRRQR